MAVQRALHRSRPIRVAFLVEDHHNFGVMLDAIFANCHSRWGGRFNLVVPVRDGEISQQYKKWLGAYDPDIIYSYVDLNDEQVTGFNESFCPSVLEKHRTLRERDETEQRDYTPRLSFSALTSLSTIGVCGRGGYVDHQQPRYVIDADFGDRDRFVGDSFGSFTGAFLRSPFPRNLNGKFEPITLVAPERAIPRHGYDAEAYTVPNTVELLTRIRTDNAITFSQLAAVATPRLETVNDQWSRAFTIFVGESFVDRVSFWNSRSLYPMWLDQDFVSIRISEAQAREANFVRELLELLRLRNHVNSGGQTIFAIKSHVVGEAALNEIAEGFRQADNWSIYGVERLDSVDSALPDERALERATYLQAGGGIGSALHKWSEDLIENDELRVRPDTPDHLKFMPAELIGLDLGKWAVEIEIERAENYSGVINVQHTWRFPRRLRLHTAFMLGYQLSGPSSEILTPRVNREGLLVAFAAPESSLPVIKIPSDEDAFHYAFLRGRNWWPFGHDGDQGLPQQACQHIEVSTQGRYLDGVLSLFGGLNNAEEIILNRLWARVFEKFGASSKTTETQVANIAELLRQKFPNRATTMGEALDSNRLPKEVLKTARNLRIEPRKLEWSSFESEFSNAHQEYMRNVMAGEGRMDPQEVEEERERDLRNFERTVQRLCESGVLYQGVWSKCRSCFHESWTSIKDLDTSITCEVCGRSEAAPVNHEWDFLVNSFLSVALRENAVASLIWTLSKLKDTLGSSFYFLGPRNIYLEAYPEDARGPDGDIDLVCVSETIVRCCEVKQSSRDLNMDKFSELVRRIRPDIATIAVMEEGNQRIQQAFDRFQESLRDTRITAELMTLEEGDIDTKPIFGLQRFRAF